MQTGFLEVVAILLHVSRALGEKNFLRFPFFRSLICLKPPLYIATKVMWLNFNFLSFHVSTQKKLIATLSPQSKPMGPFLKSDRFCNDKHLAKWFPIFIYINERKSKLFFFILFIFLFARIELGNSYLNCAINNLLWKVKRGYYVFKFPTM